MANDCAGHPAGAFDPMGVTVYCDGSCRPKRQPTEDQVAAVKAACLAGDCPTCFAPARRDGLEPLLCPYCDEALGFTDKRTNTWITNPWLDESGRFDVDPREEYGEAFERWFEIVTN